MSRLARLVVATTALTLLAVSAGGLVRATGSGLGCPGWPKCYGRWIPPAEAHAVIEWSHRFLVQASIWAAVAVCLSVVIWHRRDRLTLGLALGIVPLFVAQAALGAYVVHRKLEAWTVVAHLGLAMVLVGLLVRLVVHLSPRPREGDPGVARLAAVTGLAVLALMLIGSYVTGRGAGLAFKDWPLMAGHVVPPGLDRTGPFLQFAHRLAAVVAGVLLAVVAVRGRRGGTAVRRLSTLAAGLFAAEVVVGGLNVFTRLKAGVVTTHLALSALIWATLVALWATARATPPTGAPEAAPTRGDVADRPAVLDKVLAFVALTKPRIIELLLVTTVPTMFVAKRGVPSGWLVLATVTGGTLAAGGANAINMVVDRDIDRVMHRTRNRPLVTGIVSPAAALTFALALEVAAFVELTALVNLLSAALAVSATLFYVFVYTLWLKRSSPQNIVIGGAAGAVPVLVGWAAVTGSLGLAPVILFALIFLWTPPHFWALAIRYKDDYASADVPMLPVVASYAATARRMLAYTVLLWAASLVFYPVARMGDVYLAAAVVLGAAFTWQAAQLARRATAERAMRLFSWSISYITLLFGAIALDQVVRR